MINEKGFALITVTFMLVGLISLVFLTAYLPISEQRDATRPFITQLKYRRHVRALFGRLADQKRGEFVNCGGMCDDMAIKLPGGGCTNYKLVTTRRSYNYIKCLEGDFWNTTQHFQYDREGSYWSGYRGKHYLSPSPCDDWNYKDFRFLDDFGTPFVWWSGCSPRGIYSATDIGSQFSAQAYLYIYLKDYTRTYSSDNIRIRFPRVDDQKWTIDPSPYPVDKGDYTLHKFELDQQQCYTYQESNAVKIVGCRMLLIQTKESDGTWVTTYTTSLIIPPYSRCCARGYLEASSGGDGGKIPYFSLTIPEPL